MGSEMCIRDRPFPCPASLRSGSGQGKGPDSCLLQTLVVGSSESLILLHSLRGQKLSASDHFSAVLTFALTVLEGDDDPFGHAVVESDLFSNSDIPHRHQVVPIEFIGLYPAIGIAGMIDQFKGKIHSDVGIAIELQRLPGPFRQSGYRLSNDHDLTFLELLCREDPSPFRTGVTYLDR